MDYKLLIQEYLDGELPPDAESQLFMALSSSEELRKEMKDTIALDKGMSKRVSAFVPASASTMNIFTQLGIGGAVGAATTAAALGFKGSVLAFLSTHSAAVISAIVAMALTAGSFLAFYNPPDKQKIAGNRQQQQFDIGGSQNLEPPTVKAFSMNRDNVHNILFRVDTVIRYITRTVPNEPNKSTNNREYQSGNLIENGTVKRQEQRQASLFEFSIPAINTNITVPETQNFNIDYPISNNYSPIPVDLQNNINSGISFEIKGNGYWSIPHTDVPQYDKAALANLQLSALYGLSDNLKIGIDLRQETFYQKFIGKNEIGEEFEYKQEPNYYTFSIFGRYSLLQNTKYGIFAQASFGATATGGVSRLMFGFELSPYSSISFLMGIEGSMLSYIHQNNIFNSPKIGLNYGVAFNF